MYSNTRDLEELLRNVGVKCFTVFQNRWESDESEMIILEFPDGEKRYIKPEFSINDDSWVDAGTFEQINSDFIPDAKEPVCLNSINKPTL